MKLSAHATVRCRQRGYQMEDVDLLRRFGTATADGIYLRKRDAKEAVRELKRQIAAIERVEGTLVVVEGETVVTVQRPRRWKERRTLMRSELSGGRRRRDRSKTSLEAKNPNDRKRPLGPQPHGSIGDRCDG